MQTSDHTTVARKKTYVTVDVHHDTEGVMTPLAIHWTDDRTFEIDEVQDVRQAASLKVGGAGIRYTIRIGEVTTFLWYENPRWFVEEIVNAG